MTKDIGQRYFYISYFYFEEIILIFCFIVGKLRLMCEMIVLWYTHTHTHPNQKTSQKS